MLVRKWFSKAIILSLLLCVNNQFYFAMGVPPRKGELRGFPADSVKRELDYEDKFKSMVSSQSIEQNSRALTAEPHLAGTKEDYATAQYVQKKMAEYGL